MVVYIVMIKGLIQEKVFTGVSGLCREYPMRNRQTISKSINSTGKYITAGFQVHRCEVIRGNQKGQKANFTR